jgi:hypothetical protein
MVCSILVSERRRHGKRRFRLDLSNGMRIAALTNVADDSRTMLKSGLALQRRPAPQARTNANSVISAPPFTL